MKTLLSIFKLQGGLQDDVEETYDGSTGRYVST
jgi:hypothetical protein